MEQQRASGSYNAVWAKTEAGYKSGSTQEIATAELDAMKARLAELEAMVGGAATPPLEVTPSASTEADSASERDPELPAPLSGTVWKKSPAGPVFQERQFAVADGVLSYTSGKGETQSVPVAQLTKVDVADPTRLEFLISTSVGGGRDFLCRAATQAELAYWVGGLTAHMAAEAARQAAVARRAAEEQVAEMEAERVAEAQRRRASGASRVISGHYRAHLQARVDAGAAKKFEKDRELAEMREKVAAMELKVKGAGAAAASKPAARGSVKPSTANAFIGKGLSGTLSKQSPAFPYPWQKREVEVVGEAIMYKAGGGAQKAISVREIKAIRMTDAVKFEFEVVTSNHSYKFRGSDKTNAFQWVNGLQQLHNRVLHAK